MVAATRADRARVCQRPLSAQPRRRWRRSGSPGFAARMGVRGSARPAGARLDGGTRRAGAFRPRIVRRDGAGGPAAFATLHAAEISALARTPTPAVGMKFFCTYWDRGYAARMRCLHESLTAQ